MLRNIDMAKRIFLLIIIMIISFIFFGGAMRWGIQRLSNISISKAEDFMLQDQKEKLHIAVHSMAITLSKMTKQETIAEKKNELIRNAISTIRFDTDKSGYYFVYDFEGVNIAHPTNPEFQGTNRLDIKDTEGKPYIRELRDVAGKGGFVEYTFKKPGNGNVKKLAYSEIIPGTDYWIATGLYIDNFQVRKAELGNQIQGLSNNILMNLIVAFLVFLLVIIYPFTRAIIRSILKPLNNITNAVKVISQGNYEVKVDTSGNDELSELGTSFNEMTSKLIDAKKIMSDYQDHLEDLVVQRTEELSQSFKNLENANAEVLESIEYARTIQQSILPPDSAISEYLKDYFVIWDPKDIIGGDFYWFKGTKNGFLLGVIDCTGHGVPGAIMTMIAGTTLDRVTSGIGIEDPARILSEMDKLIRQTLSQNLQATESNDGLDIGLCFVENNETIIFSGARISLFTIQGDSITEIKGDHYSVGYKSSNTSITYKNHSIKAEQGTNFYMATDGLKGQIGGESHMPFGKTRLMALLQSAQKLPLKEQKEVINKCFEGYCSDEIRRDDVTLFGFRL